MNQQKYLDTDLTWKHTEVYMLFFCGWGGTFTEFKHKNKTWQRENIHAVT